MSMLRGPSYVARKDLPLRSNAANRRLRRCLIASAYRGYFMSKAFLAQVIQESVGTTAVAANQAAGAVMDAIVLELKKTGKFTLPSFGTFTVKKTKARKALNPRTGEPVKVKAGKTVRFKASPTLKNGV